MNARFPRTALVSGVALVVAGLVPVLYFVALFVWQITTLFLAGSWVALPATLLFTDHALLQAGKAAPVLPFIPEFPWAGHQAVAVILDRLHVGVVFALVGIAVIAFGALSALRHLAAIRARKQRDEDRVRRMRDYRRDDSRVGAVDGRLEPYIGTGGGRNVDRRVA
jgi:hypothetical protein